MSTIQPKKLRLACVTWLLKPLLLFCLRHSLRLQDLIEVCKETFVELAKKEIEERGARVSISKISLMTGVHRKDVSRILSDTPFQTTEDNDLISRVIGRWQADPNFLDSMGRPKALSFEGTESQFKDLVELESKEVKSYTVLFELERLELVEKSDGELRLLSKIYLPKGDVKEGFRILSHDLCDLAMAVEENMNQETRIPNLHIRTEYDNIPVSKMDALRHWLLDEGSAFHQRMRDFLAPFDRDINPSPEDTSESIKVSVGAFSHIHKMTKKEIK